MAFSVPIKVGTEKDAKTLGPEQTEANMLHPKRRLISQRTAAFACVPACATKPAHSGCSVTFNAETDAMRRKINLGPGSDNRKLLKPSPSCDGMMASLLAFPGIYISLLNGSY